MTDKQHMPSKHAKGRSQGGRTQAAVLRGSASAAPRRLCGMPADKLGFSASTLVPGKLSQFPVVRYCG